MVNNTATEKTDLKETKKHEDKILFRSRDDYMFTGVIGGLAYFWGMNSTTLRILFLGVSLLTSGLAIIVYLILSRIIPLEPEIEG